MFSLRRWLLILSALMLGGEPLFAAGARENRDYAAAAGAFQDGMWGRADTEFAQFVTNYPASSHNGEAILLRAQAELKMREFTNSIALLTGTNNLANAGILADQYFYWTGEAQFQSENYPDAAAEWITLAQKFPKSTLRLRAVVEAASAFTQLADWRQTVSLLAETNGVFQLVSQTEPDNELVVRGELLLAQAKFKLKDFAGASAILEPLLDSKTLKPGLRRQSGLLLYQVKIAAGELDAALTVTTNLLQIARLEKNDDWYAESMALRAGTLEKLGRAAEAIAAYQENLTNNAPLELKSEAILNIAELAIAQKQYPAATNALGKFLAQFPDSPSADAAFLTLAELNLKNYVAQPGVTNQLSDVQTNFDVFIGMFTNSPLLGRAYLDRGWCHWLAVKIPESLDDFKTAAQKIAAQELPPSKDLLVAWFKMGDAQLAQKDYAGALENYRAVLEGLKISPDADATLEDAAWYQILRVSLEMNDVAGASNAFEHISKKFPAGELAQSSALLYGESLARPEAARELFEKLSSQLSGSPLQPQIALAVARTYERDQKWAAAITNYEGWLEKYPTNALLSRVDYALALANYQAGNESNAFLLFTNFIAQFPTNELAPFAQWWVADHFFRAGDWADAERNYKAIFQNAGWQNSPLIWQAQMMAGRAALGRLGFLDAIGYFTGLAENTNCPPELLVPARFAYGSTLMLMNSTDTNNPWANFQAATNVFGEIAQANPTNDWGAQAMIETGNCDLQMNNFDAATNAYAQVFDSPFASISARSQAQIGFGITLEKKAALLNGAAQRTLLKQALDNYLAVFDSRLAASDPFWVQKAGLQALPLSTQLGLADPDKFIDHLEDLFPQLQEMLEKQRAALLAEKK
jgi:TolA-binding protein